MHDHASISVEINNAGFGADQPPSRVFRADDTAHVDARQGQQAL
jgi:hypothetical protein